MTAPLRLLLVDDEAPAIARLQHLVGELPDVSAVGVARNGEEAVEKIRELRPDAILLDVQMPGRSGVSVAEALGVDAPGPQVIFVTAFDHYAARAFEVEATDYLLKPVSRDRLGQALERARRRRRAEAAQLAPETGGDFLWAPGKGGMARVPVAAITWVEAAGDYVLLHTPARTHMLRATMSEMAERLAAGGLIRVHRSALVRPASVLEVTRAARPGLSLMMDDGSAVPVGPSYQKAALAALGVRGLSPE